MASADRQRHSDRELAGTLPLGRRPHLSRRAFGVLDLIAVQANYGRLLVRLANRVGFEPEFPANCVHREPGAFSPYAGRKL